MFVQIHMLQSMPPGNLNRDETGQPKKCLFGGVTRGRISSQCLKRNIRRSREFEDAFGDALASRTQYLPRMVADALKEANLGVPEDELGDVMGALAGRFKKENRESEPDESQEDDKDEEQPADSARADEGGKTGQLVFFPPPFAGRIAELVADLRNRNERAYSQFLGRRLKPKPSKDEEKQLKAEIDRFVTEAFAASQSLTVDIAMFGRMTTSDLVKNVEAACQVAHAITTHEILVESDYFTAMDDEKETYASAQSETAGAAFLGSGETETFFDSGVYYKYLNLDVDALKKYLPSLSDKEAARAAGVLVMAAALANPTGKQNSFAAHGVPELILVEVSKAKRPISYANAFLQAVEGGAGRNLMAESAKAFCAYVEEVGAAFAPADTHRVFMAVGPAKVPVKTAHCCANTPDDLVKCVVGFVASPDKTEVTV